MRLQEIPSYLASIKSSKESFNPYSDRDNNHDNLESPQVRLKNLKNYLSGFRNPQSLWMGEAPSYKGLRRTGVPLIPESKLKEASNILGLGAGFQKATTTKAETTYTANIIWKEAKKMESMPLFWNTVMIHTHQPEKSLSNRKPNKKEIETFNPVLKALISNHSFEHIISIGKVSHNTLKKMDIENTYVRHPAQGGANTFRKQIRNLYRIH